MKVRQSLILIKLAIYCGGCDIKKYTMGLQQFLLTMQNSYLSDRPSAISSLTKRQYNNASITDIIPTCGNLSQHSIIALPICILYIHTDTGKQANSTRKGIFASQESGKRNANVNQGTEVSNCRILSGKWDDEFS